MPSAYSVSARWHGDARHHRLSITGEPANRMHALVTVDRIAAETWADRIATDPAIASVCVIDAETGREVVRDA